MKNTMSNDNRQKVVRALIILICALLVLFIARIMHIVEGFRIAKEFKYVKQISYPFEIKMLLWNALPFLVMWIDILWQRRSLRKYHTVSINTRPITIMSIAGAIFYYFIETSSSVGIAIIPVRILTPILMVTGYVFLRLGFHVKDDRRQK